ncbi:uncharacterized protein V1516DRAFT_544251 [Lipomyces oligophaga]|uniref:uncharacterized protein n=1 Tax=Lipomyces oligophaga TaxID=45792 RepID=UPI0034CE1768
MATLHSGQYILTVLFIVRNIVFKMKFQRVPEIYLSISEALFYVSSSGVLLGSVLVVANLYPGRLASLIWRLKCLIGIVCLNS